MGDNELPHWGDWGKLIVSYPLYSRGKGGIKQMKKLTSWTRWEYILAAFTFLFTAYVIYGAIANGVDTVLGLGFGGGFVLSFGWWVISQAR
jgi:hypothetical protein